MLHIAIIDDSRAEQLHIQQLLFNYGHDCGIDIQSDVYSSSDSFLSSLSGKHYDVVFSDIYMNDTSGIEMADIFRHSFPTTPIIFITTSSEHHADAFCVHAFDYLKKPVTQEQIHKVMNDLSYFKHTSTDNNYITLSIDRKAIPVLYSDIRYISSDSNYLLIHTDEILRCRMPFKKLVSMLDDSRFLVINRGILVNLDHVLSMNTGCCHMTDEMILPINTKRLKGIQQAYINRQFEKRTTQLTEKMKGERV